MKASAIVVGLTGVRACVVGDDAGHVIERSGVDGDDAGPALAAAPMLATSLGVLGSLLGLGSLEVVTTKGANTSWVFASGTGASIAVRVEGGPTVPVEAVLRTTDWFSLIEWDVRDSDLELLTSPTPRDDRRTRPAPELDTSAESASTVSPPAPAAAPPPAPVRDGRGAESAVKWRAAPNAFSMALKAAQAAADVAGGKGLDRMARERRPRAPDVFEEVEITRSAGQVLPSTPPFVGRLQTLCLADLLEFLRNGQRTGTTIFSSAAGRARIHVRAGRVTGASSPTTKPLPGYLVATGAATAEALRALRQIGEGGWSKPNIGRVLAAAGTATVAQVRTARGAQIRDAVAEILTWHDGEFSFESEPSPAGTAESDEELEFDSQEILLGLLTQQDEAARASK